jgi:NAD(P)-dependent dehydrogenase (short-subunit alcohol dehydrogenase family)
MLPRLQYVRLPVVGHDLKHRKIRVNTVSPGSINTPFLNPVLSKHQNEQFLNNVLKFTPLGRMGSPDEVAKAVLFLASDYSSYITGIELFGDGGVAQI